MTIFKFKDRSICPVVMHVRTAPGGVITAECRCRLRVNHDGPHRGDGLVWANSEAMIRKWQEEALDPNRPRIFLGGR